MLTTLALILLHSQDFGKVNLDAAFQLVRSITDENQSVDGGLVDWSWRTKAPATFGIDPELDWVVMRWGEVEARFVRSTGQFRSLNVRFWSNPNNDKVRMIKDSDGMNEADCLQKAKDFLRLVRPIEDLEVLFTFKEPKGIADDVLSLRNYDFQGVPKVGDLRMADQYGFRVKIDRTRGQLLEMKVPDMPDVSLAGEFRRPLEELEQFARDAYSASHPFKNGQYWSRGLQLEVPSFGKLSDMDPKYQALVKAYKAIPTFVLWIADLDSRDKEDNLTRSQLVTLDARDGTVLAIQDN